MMGRCGRRSLRACGMAMGPTPWPKRGDGIGDSGYKHQKGEKVIAIIDNHGYVLAPVPVAPVNETDMVLLPESLQALKKVAKEVGLDLRGAYLNLDGGFDSIANRALIMASATPFCFCTTQKYLAVKRVRSSMT